jgi:hypothetical protein
MAREQFQGRCPYHLHRGRHCARGPPVKARIKSRKAVYAAYLHFDDERKMSVNIPSAIECIDRRPFQCDPTEMSASQDAATWAACQNSRTLV